LALALVDVSDNTAGLKKFPDKTAYPSISVDTILSISKKWRLDSLLTFRHTSNCLKHFVKEELRIMKLRKPAILSMPALVLLILTAACSSKPFLIVQYQLPTPSQPLEGKTVSLSIKDMRNNDAFLRENAKKSLSDFNDTFSLVVLRQDGSGDLVGAYRLLPLLKEIFTQRLKNIGIETTEDVNMADAELEIALQKFDLDLVDRKWITNMTYQANLIKDGKVRAIETVSGAAERLKVMGKSEAEKTLGEIVSDMVNKLDLIRLFQQAGM
jgi:hypothetical protein